MWLQMRCELLKAVPSILNKRSTNKILFTLIVWKLRDQYLKTWDKYKQNTIRVNEFFV